MQCPLCHAENLASQRFCSACGRRLNRTACTHCGFTNDPEAKFCGGCGRPTEASAIPGIDQGILGRRPRDRVETPVAARRQLTVMFCDLVGSTALSSQIDPEDLAAVMLSYQEFCANLISEFDGFIDRHLGDGILVYFGYPRAREDAAECAVRAALRIVRDVGKLDTCLDTRLQVRIGIATGPVVISNVVEIGASQEQPVVGETLNLSARLQTIAAPNGIVIAPSTRRLLGGLFEYVDLGSHNLKGFTEPVLASGVIRESEVESRFEALHSSALTPLVGREEELDLLLRRWRRAKTAKRCLLGLPTARSKRLRRTTRRTSLL